MKNYYALTQNEGAADITIYGDITSWPWMENDVSAYLLSKQIDQIEAERINVYLNSFGGEVAEGLAIYNALKRHKAKVVTYCDGFACSAASIVFMAGDERIMGEASLLMIHNAWTSATGNAADLRKAAEDLETISEAAANAYRTSVNIDDAELDGLLAMETWIPPQNAVEMGFATGIESYQKGAVPSANARQAVAAKMLAGNPAPVQVNLDADTVAQKIIDRLNLVAGKQDNKPTTFLSALMRGKETT